MKQSRQAFLDSPQKAITLLGMSGVGKSHWGCQLEKWGWENYSCDFLIGTHYLADALAKTFGSAEEIRADKIAFLSRFVGQLGNPDKGGLPLKDFQKRQRDYYEAERQSLIDAAEVIDKAREQHFVCDSTGSLCEITEDDVLDALGQRSLFVYLEADPQTQKQVLRRAIDYPKPIFVPPALLSEFLERYLADHNLQSAEDIDPDDFSRALFPVLFKARLPKYQRLADRYGVTIPASAFQDIGDEHGFVSVIADHLPDEAEAS